MPTKTKTEKKTKAPKKVTKVEMHWDSSMIESTVYDFVKETLQVNFVSGGSYMYSDVTNMEYLEFSAADSQGKHFIAHIRDAKDCKKI